MGGGTQRPLGVAISPKRRVRAAQRTGAHARPKPTSCIELNVHITHKQTTIKGDLLKIFVRFEYIFSSSNGDS